MNRPIQSQREADEVLQYIVNTTAKTLNISKDEAERRVNGMRKSGILNYGSPDDPRSRELIDLFMMIPSRNHKELIPEMLAMAKSIYGK